MPSAAVFIGSSLLGRYKKIEAAYEQNVIMPELEHRRQVLKKLRQQFEPMDLKQIAREWDENHPVVEAVHKKSKMGGNAGEGVKEEFSAFAGMPSVYRFVHRRYGWLQHLSSRCVSGDQRSCARSKRSKLPSWPSKKSIRKRSTSCGSSGSMRRPCGQKLRKCSTGE